MSLALACTVQSRTNRLEKKEREKEKKAAKGGAFWK